MSDLPSTLLLDIGNTRLKWAVLQGSNLSPQRASTYDDWTATEVRDQVLLPAGPLQRVLVANVGGAKVAQAVQDAAVAALGIQPEFVRSTARACGVTNAYPEPEKLGVDRWMAVLAARSIEQRSACIVCVGTAMTIDGLDPSGRHLGGLIVPGPDLMTSSLMRNTSDIARHAAGGRVAAGLFADNTLGAVHQGALHALSALIMRAIEAMSAQQLPEPTLFLTGGASDQLIPFISTPARQIPDLVLRGLAVVAQTAGNPQA
jgi:type III pantothenate kinase